MKRIRFNGRVFRVGRGELPMLVHGREHGGASLFSMTVAAEWFRQRNELLVLCGYSMAQVEFEQQMGVSGAGKFFLPDQVDGFVEAVKGVKVRQQETLVLIKNHELFHGKVVEAIWGKKELMVSGDLDRCACGEKLLKKKWQTKVVFSQPELELGFEVPGLDQYEGFWKSGEKAGVVKVEGERQA